MHLYMHNGGMLNNKESNMNELENLKKQRTHWLKAYNNMRPFAGETPTENLARREEYLNNYRSFDKQIKKVQRLQRGGA